MRSRHRWVGIALTGAALAAVVVTAHPGSTFKAFSAPDGGRSAGGSSAEFALAAIGHAAPGDVFWDEIRAGAGVADSTGPSGHSVPIIGSNPVFAPG